MTPSFFLRDELFGPCGLETPFPPPTPFLFGEGVKFVATPGPFPPLHCRERNYALPPSAVNDEVVR